MARNRAPIDDNALIRCGEELWKRNEFKVWENIDATERVLMAYANPRAAWLASDVICYTDPYPT